MIGVDKLLIKSQNGRGLANPNKRRRLFCWLKQTKANIILLQETHSTPDCENVWIQDWGGTIVFAHGSSAARGTCILFSKQLDITMYKSFIDPNGRYVI